MKIDDKTLERNFKALANRRRLLILKSLKARKSASVGQIAEDIRLSFKATSKHLGVLYAAGLLDKEQKSLTVLYRIAPSPIDPVKATLAIL